uniref:Uncharacterized protein n=1 Tax=Cacopsylla melanoneura TaxID=428564 RepID=A0A8D8PWD2_9HEMI
MNSVNISSLNRKPLSCCRTCPPLPHPPLLPLVLLPHHPPHPVAVSQARRMREKREEDKKKRRRKQKRKSEEELRRIFCIAGELLITLRRIFCVVRGELLKSFFFIYVPIVPRVSRVV